MKAMKRVVFLGLVTLCCLVHGAAHQVIFEEVAMRDGYYVGWVAVPSQHDAVLVRIDKDGWLTYITPEVVSPRDKQAQLPKGLFFWKSDVPQGQAFDFCQHVECVVRRKSKGIPFSRVGGAYVNKQNSSAYDPRRADVHQHPTREVETWVQGGGTQGFVKKRGVSVGQPIAGKQMPQRGVVHDNAVVKELANGDKLLDRNRLFDDVMGISEEEFRTFVGAPAHSGKKPDPKVVADWYRTHKNSLSPRAGAVEQGVFSNPTLADLRKSAGQRLLKACERGHLGSLHLIIHGKVSEHRSDIRGLQQEMPGAWFQTASNFNGLEGGMGDFTKNLSYMNHKPVQGEEASLSTMGSAIYLRYFQPTIDLLGNLDSVLVIDRTHTTPHATKIRSGVHLNARNLGGLGVVVHRDIVATSGFYPEMVLREGRLRPVYNVQLPVDGASARRVSHVITSAHNINPKHIKWRAITEDDKKIAAWLLQGAYEATLLAAIDGGARELVFTLVGGSAFANEPAWIIAAIERLADLIIASGITVHVVIRGEGQAQDAMEQAMRHVVARIDTEKKTYEHDRPALCQAIAKFFDEVGVTIVLPSAGPAVAPRAQQHNGWTSVHEALFSALTSGKVAQALKLARDLVQRGGNVFVAVPRDVDHRTLFAVAIDMNGALGGSLSKEQDWEELLGLLKGKGVAVVPAAAPSSSQRSSRFDEGAMSYFMSKRMKDLAPQERTMVREYLEEKLNKGGLSAQEQKIFAEIIQLGS